MTSLICKYMSNTIDAKTIPLQVFMKSLVNFIVIKFIIIQALTATASNSSHYVYVKYAD